MRLKWILYAGSMTIFIVVTMNLMIDDKKSLDLTRKKIEMIDFNNSTLECIDSKTPANYQRFWNYIYQNSVEHNEKYIGLAYFRIGKTYIALANLVHNLHVDLYYKPVNERANPALPITPTLRESKAADLILKQEQKIFNYSLGSNHKWTRKVNDLYRMLQSNGEPFFLNNIRKEINLRTIGDYKLHEPEKIRMLGAWCLEKSKTHLLKELAANQELTSDQYRNWLALVNLTEYGAVDWTSISQHEVYRESLIDSISNNAYEIGMIIDAIPQIVNLKWAEPKSIIAAFEKAEVKLPGLLVELSLLSKNIGKVEDLVNPIIIPDDIGNSDDLFLGPKLILFAAEYLYKTEQYQDGMYLMTRFWHESTKTHPTKYWCFDNYPEYLLRSYLVARWDGGRLPQFNNDFYHIIGDDPVLISVQELLQIYIGVIANSLNSTNNHN